MAKITVKVEKTTTGFSAYADKYSAFTTGRTVEELVTNMVESLNLYFEAEGKVRVIAQNDLRFELELASIFDVYPIINMKALSNRLGMNYTLLAQYASGKKKPSPKQAEKIIEGIHKIGRELTELQLVGS
jgi:predicted RNase H-like HicB family nuclease